MTHSRRSLALLVGAAATALAACTRAPTPAPEPAGATSATTSTASTAAGHDAHSSHASHATHAASGIQALPPGARHTLADARFMEHMIHHHAQALGMSRLVPSRSSRTELRLLAERIAVSQRDEIAQMQRWLRVRGHQPPEVSEDLAAQPEHAGMPGMATSAELARLVALRGPEFDRLFLELMIRHHQGALVMVRELHASPGAAQETETWSIASEIDADQQMEIDRMRGLLAGMPSGAGGQ